MRARLTLAASTAALALGGSVFAATPASAQGVTFTLSAGLLSVAEPATAVTLTAGSVVSIAGTTLSGSLGSTTVTDNRGDILGWTSKVTGTTDFTNGAGRTVIPVTAAKVWIPAGGITTTGTVTATQGAFLTQATGMSLTSAAQTLVTATAVIGVDTATFNPSISVAIPANATSGTYSGAVTQTVS